MSYGPCGSWGRLHIGLWVALRVGGLCNQVVTGRSQASEILLELKLLSSPDQKASSWEMQSG